MLRKLLVGGIFIAATSFASVTNAKDVCSDSYLAGAIAGEAAAANSVTGLCQSARAQIKLMKKAISLVDKCRHVPSLVQARSEFVKTMKQAEVQARGTCG